MRKGLLLVWLLLPVVVGFYHAGPGQRQRLLDDVADTLASAERYAAQENWSFAEKQYAAALALLPSDRVAAQRRIRLERAKAQLLNQQLPEAYQDLANLVAELEADTNADANILAEARSAQASTQYYLTWLMRLEGEPRQQWEPEIEAARQNYRLLAENALATGDTVAAKRHQQDLESAIRLARMDLSDLQALSLPCQCKGCCSGQCCGTGKKRGRGQSQAKKQAKDARGASSGPPPDDGGS